MNKKFIYCLLAMALVVLGAYPLLKSMEFTSCLSYAFGGFRPVAVDRAERFLGKIEADTARCRGGGAAKLWRTTPWLDWQRYWSASGQEKHFRRDRR